MESEISAYTMSLDDVRHRFRPPVLDWHGINRVPVSAKPLDGVVRMRHGEA